MRVEAVDALQRHAVRFLSHEELAILEVVLRPVRGIPRGLGELLSWEDQ